MDVNPVPLITPFNQDLSLDLKSFENHLDFLRTNGVRAIIIGGTTGEGLALTTAEIRAMVSTAKRYPELELWGAIATFSKAIDDLIQAFDGCSHLLVMPQFFVRPSKQDIINFYNLILSKSTQNIILYNNPSRTMISIADMYHDLSKLSNRIVGAKETTFTNKPDIRFWCGDDSAAVDQVGYGLISALANLEPKLADKIAKREFSQDDASTWSSLVADMFKFPNPLCIKRKLKDMGIIANDVTRFPIDIWN